MANIFDSLQDGLFNLTTRVFGYDAEWQPSAGGALQAARVHYKKPNEPRDMFRDVEYNPYIHMMEYKEGDFVGLAEAIRDGAAEQVTVNGVLFYIREVKAHWDGKTFRAQLEPIP